MIVLWWLALERRQSQRVLIENARRLQIIDESIVLLERTSDLFPRDEFRYLLRQLPELFEVNVTIWQSEEGNQ